VVFDAIYRETGDYFFSTRYPLKIKLEYIERVKESSLQKKSKTYPHFVEKVWEKWLYNMGLGASEQDISEARELFEELVEAGKKYWETSNVSYLNILSGRGWDEKQAFDAGKELAKRQKKSILQIKAQFTKENVKKEIAQELGVDTEDIEIEESEKQGQRIYIARIGNEEYEIIESEDKAEQIAIEQVEEDLELEPELFDQNWLMNFVDVEEYIRDIRYDIEEWVEESPESYTTFIDNEEPKGEEGEYSEEQKERMVEGYLEDIKSDIFEFLKCLGYTGKELMKHLLPYINIDDAAEEAIATDGWQHFLATYDEISKETESGFVFYRTASLNKQSDKLEVPFGLKDQKVEMVKGDHKGKKGIILEETGYIETRGVVVKIQIQILFLY
jgi:hypothetical protein